MVGARLQFPYVRTDRKSQPKNKNTHVSHPNRVDVEFGMLKSVVNHEHFKHTSLALMVSSIQNARISLAILIFEKSMPKIRFGMLSK